MDIKVSSTIAIISSLGLSFTSYMAYADTRELEKFETTKVYSPSSFLETIQKQPESLQSLKKESHNPDEYSSYAFIEGYAECEKPIFSEIDRKTPLVYRHAFRKDLFSNDSVSGTKAFSPTLTIETSRPSTPVSFNLKDPLTDDVCRVHRNLDVDATGAVERINQRAKTRELKLIEKIFVQFGKFLDLGSSLFRNILPVRGVHIGWTETELGVTVGSALTVYGRVLYNSKMKSLCIQTPLYFLKEKATILKKLTERLGKWNLAFYMFLIPFTLSTSYLLRKIIAHRRAAKKLLEEQEWDRIEKVKFANLEDEYKCVVCLERPRNVILKPCMHFSLCRRCYNSLHRNVCPICKKTVADTIAISFPSS